MFEICKMEWHDIMWMVERLADKLQDKRVWGVPRGGQIVATLMAYHGCKLVHDQLLTDIVIDDVADTGRTLLKVAAQGIPEYHADHPTAALVVRKGCNPMPDYWVAMFNTEDYIMFPWETEQEHINFMNTHYKGEQDE